MRDAVATFPPVLDPCCGSRMWWFDRQHPDAIYGDRRQETITDAQIQAVWESMPGGPDGFRKQWGFNQFARAILALAAEGASGVEGKAK